MFKRELRPSPALVVAVLALFFALGGAAGAAVTAAVPLAKRALTADNAKKLNGFSATQIATAGARAGAEIPGAGEHRREPRQREDDDDVDRGGRRG